MIDFRRHIDGFDAGYAYDPARSTRRRPGIELLADGAVYTFVVLDAQPDLVGEHEKPIVRLTLKVEETEQEVEHVYWLDSQVSVNILGQDLVTLGFDADRWVPPRNFSDELYRLLQSRQLVGCRFNAKKAVKQANGKTNHRLYVNWGLGRVRARPATSANGHGAPQGQEVPPPPDDAGGGIPGDDIPF